MCNIFHAPILKREPMDLPVGSWLVTLAIPAHPHHHCHVFKSGAVQLVFISVSYSFTTATEVGWC